MLGEKTIGQQCFWEHVSKVFLLLLYPLPYITIQYNFLDHYNVVVPELAVEGKSEDDKRNKKEKYISAT